MTIKTTNFSDEWEMSSNLLNQSLQWPLGKEEVVEWEHLEREKNEF